MPATTTHDGAEPGEPGRGGRRARRLAWFIGLYIAGVAVVSGVAWLIRIANVPQH